MPGISIRHISITLLTGLLCLIGPAAAPGRAQAEQMLQVTVIQDMVSVGLAFGQTLRYTWANLSDADPGEHVFEPLRVGVKLLAADGSVIAQEAAAAVGAGRFQSFEFKRGLIGLPGEAGTGRLQVRLEVAIVGRAKFNDILLKRGVIVESFDDAVEIINDSGGGTAVSFGGGRNELALDDTAGKEKLEGEGFQIISAGRDHLVGIIPGQTLRLSAVNPFATDADGRKYKMLFAVIILDVDGRVLAQGAEVEVAPGASHSFDFPRADLPAAGEPGTGRLQVRAEIRRFFPGIVSRISQGGRDAAPAALEIVDASGRSVLLLSSKPKEIVVVGSK